MPRKKDRILIGTVSAELVDLYSDFQEYMMLTFPFYDHERFDARGIQICIYKPEPHCEVEEAIAISCWDKVENKYVVYTADGPAPEEFFSIFRTVRITGKFTDTKGMGDGLPHFRLQCYGRKPVSFDGPLMPPGADSSDETKSTGKVYTGEVFAKASGSGDESIEHYLKIEVDGYDSKTDFCTGCDILIYYNPEEEGVIRFDCVGNCDNQYISYADPFPTVPEVFAFFKEFIIVIGDVPSKSKVSRKDIRPLDTLDFQY